MGLGNHNGRPVDSYLLDNGKMSVRIMSLGATILEINVPDKSGKKENVVLEHKDLECYAQGVPCYFSALIGRTCGRIPEGKLHVGNEVFQIEVNENGNTLHGGKEGFWAKIWELVDQTKTSLTLAYTSPDGEQGYPGTLKVQVKYTLDEKNSLHIEYTATGDKDTAVNLTNHAYFNLSGDNKETVRDQLMYFDVTGVLETDDKMIASGRVLPVAGTGFDFNTPKPIGQDMDGCYDCCFLLGDKEGPKASLEHPASGRKMEVYTDQKSIVCYSDFNTDGAELAQGRHVNWSGVCFEAQSPNVGTDGSFVEDIFLKAGDTYTQHTEYRFIF